MLKKLTIIIATRIRAKNLKKKIEFRVSVSDRIFHKVEWRPSKIYTPVTTFYTNQLRNVLFFTLFVTFQVSD